MKAAQPSELRMTTVGMRRLLLVAGGLVFIAGFQLSVLTEQTDRYFAWTIRPPLTAAFLGAGYWASCFLEFLAARQRLWARARIAVPAVLVFTTLTLAATLLHLSRFHFGSPEQTAEAAAWFWLVIYATVPPAMLALLFRQIRMPGRDPPREAPLPLWMRLALATQGTSMLALGAALLVAPETTAPLWPWFLTPLTGRAVGAWLLGIGVAAIHTLWENDLVRVQAALASYSVFGLLQLLALARYPADMDWNGARAWLYVLFLVSVLFVGFQGWRVARAKASG